MIASSLVVIAKDRDISSTAWVPEAGCTKELAWDGDKPFPFVVSAIISVLCLSMLIGA
jgi:hypothetical protein